MALPAASPKARYDPHGKMLKDEIQTVLKLEEHLGSRVIGQGQALEAISQRIRTRVEEIFGWLKTVGGLRKTRHRGVERVGWMFTFALAAYNLVRMRNLAADIHQAGEESEEEVLEVARTAEARLAA